ncbi:hypothetical protein [Lysobacter sp. cf310]|uniref:hypothetical protein n=1 Tax=Lysobacter sp. cf310 TaxID=1761790 RepID=UPI0008E0DD04|nr:hypothetical protein [Lysobacter sp. cf310]SFL29854.1 NTF2 fold immunity protein [Lysobacter sp. cf310]
MRGGLGLLLCLFMSVALAAKPVPASTPDGLVRAFLADYQAWNDRAQRAVETEGQERGVARAQADYDRLLRAYCQPGFRGEPLAFGSRANHSPADERILSTDIDGARAVVRTRDTHTIAGTVLEADYEYRLIRADGRWYLQQVYYVDDEGRYPSL